MANIKYRIYTDGRFWYTQELSNGLLLFRSNNKEKCEDFIQAYDKSLNYL